MGCWATLLLSCSVLLAVTSTSARFQDINQLGLNHEKSFEPSLGGGNVHPPKVGTHVEVAAKRSTHAVAEGSSRLLKHAPEHTPVPVMTVVLYTLLMCSATGLGAVPFFYVKSLTAKWSGLANAVASGVMLACSFDLIHEGQPYNPALVITGVVLGALFIKASQEWLSQFEEVSFDSLQGADARKAMLMVGVMAAHAIGEGSGVGVSFGGEKGWTQGTLVTLAIGLHNIPEGLAVATVMATRGSPPMRTLMWTLFTALPQPLLAVPSYIFVETFSSMLPLAMGFAAGCMIWIVFAELVPDALEAIPGSQAATAATLSAAWLEGMRMLVGSMEESSQPMHLDLAASSRYLLALLPAWLLCMAAAAAAAATFGQPGRLGLGVGVQAMLAGSGGVQLLFRCSTLPQALQLLVAGGLGGTGWVLLARWVLQQMQAVPEASECNGFDHKRVDVEEQEVYQDRISREGSNGCIRRMPHANGRLLHAKAEPEHANGESSPSGSSTHADVVLQLRDQPQRYHHNGIYEDVLPMAKAALLQLPAHSKVLSAEPVMRGPALMVATGLMLAASNIPRALGVVQQGEEHPGQLPQAILPLLLLGGLVGLICPALCPNTPGWRPAVYCAAAVGAVQPVAALLQLLRPAGSIAEAEQWILLMQATACGALAASCCLGLWRLSAGVGRQHWRMGLALGLYLGLVATAAGLLCCHLTPYCVHGIVFA